MDPLLHYFIIEILSDFLVMPLVDATKERERERELKNIVEGFSFLIYRTLGSWQRDSLCACVSRVRCLCVYVSIENRVFLHFFFFFR